MRHLIQLIETVLGESDIERALEILLNRFNLSHDANVLANMGYGPDEEEIDTDSPEFKEELRRWAVNRIDDVECAMDWRFKGDRIEVWRVITAPKNWMPTPGRHPGIYWSWDEHAAEAHWGTFGEGNVKWLLHAWVTKDQIDWPATIAANADPDMEEEREVTLLDNTPVEFDYKRVR